LQPQISLLCSSIHRQLISIFMHFIVHQRTFLSFTLLGSTHSYGRGPNLNVHFPISDFCTLITVGAGSRLNLLHIQLNGRSFIVRKLSLMLYTNTTIKMMSDGASFSYEKFVCDKLAAYKTIQVSRTRNMADDRYDNLAVAATIVLSALTTRTSNQ